MGRIIPGESGPGEKRRGRKNLGKTKTIVKRRVAVYLPDFETRQRWEDQAGRSNMPVSEWVRWVVEEATKHPQTLGKERRSLDDCQEARQSLEKTVSALEKEIKQLSLAKDRLEAELGKYQKFAQEKFEGWAEMNLHLIQCLRTARNRQGEPRPVSEEEIFALLGIDPRDTERSKEICNQLAILERYKFLEKVVHGWRWKDE